MTRALALAYGLFSYALFLGVFLYLIGFVSGHWVPTTVDRGAGDWGLAGNLGLIFLFGLQHTIMARAKFKSWFIRFVPQPIERSTFVLVTALILVLLYSQWTTLEGTVWNIEAESLRVALYTIAGVGWLIALISTFLINHFDLFGLRQTVLYFLGKEYTPIHFKKIAFYRHIRHPLMLGFLIAFWSTPTLTVGHLTFALAMTSYILIGIQFEERELMHLHGKAYSDYRNETSMLVPLPSGK